MPKRNARDWEELEHDLNAAGVSPEEIDSGARALLADVRHATERAASLVPMPRISAFYGVVIYMYWNEKDHPVAHFHAWHAGRRASVSVEGTVLAGSLEPRALQFVREWAVLHRSEIVANWDRARRSEPLLDIAPLP